MNEAFFKTAARALASAFAGAPLDRLSERREDEAFLAALRARPDAARGRVRARHADASSAAARRPRAAVSLAAIASARRARGSRCCSGSLADGAPVFAALLADGAVEERADASDGFLDRRVLVVPGRDDIELIDLRIDRAAGPARARRHRASSAQAKAVLHWHARHGYCANCGAPTRVAAAGWRRECDTCKAQHFPRTDPVVIMLAVDGDRCLLGRQARFPKGMYSALAGFRGAGRDDRGGGAARNLSRRPASPAARSSISPRSPGRFPPR